MSVVPRSGFPSADPPVGCATQALGSGCDTHTQDVLHMACCAQMLSVSLCTGLSTGCCHTDVSPDEGL